MGLESFCGGLGFQRGDRGITIGFRGQGLGFRVCRPCKMLGCRACAWKRSLAQLLLFTRFLEEGREFKCVAKLRCFRQKGPFFNVWEFVQAYTKV